MEKNFYNYFFANPPLVERQHLERQLLSDELDGPGVPVLLALRQGVDLADDRQVVHRAGGGVRVLG